MKKKIILIIIFLIVSGSLYYFGSEKDLILHLGMANVTETESLLIEVAINGDKVFYDTIQNYNYGFHTIKKKVKGGYQEVHVKRADNSQVTTASILALANKHIIIEFSEPCDDINNADPCFKIRSMYKPFLLE